MNKYKQYVYIIDLTYEGKGRFIDRIRLIFSPNNLGTTKTSVDVFVRKFLTVSRLLCEISSSVGSFINCCSCRVRDGLIFFMGRLVLPVVVFIVHIGTIVQDRLLTRVILCSKIVSDSRQLEIIRYRPVCVRVFGCI